MDFSDAAARRKEKKKARKKAQKKRKKEQQRGGDQQANKPAPRSASSHGVDSDDNEYMDYSDSGNSDDGGKLYHAR